MAGSRLTLAACLLLLVLVAPSAALAELDDGETSEPPTIAGELKKWHPLTLSFAGPSASETSASPNPFLDHRLQVTFTGPGGQTYDVPGFFDGDGNGGSAGDVWRVRFSPDQAGTWSYKASFRSGQNVAIELDPQPVSQRASTVFRVPLVSRTATLRPPDFLSRDGLST